MENILILLIGLLAGWIASIIVKGQGSGMLSDILIGVIGSFVGSYIFRLFDLFLYGLYASLSMSVVGAIVFLLIARFLFKSRGYKSEY